MGKPFKMRGSPMKRNFPNDIGVARPGDSPSKELDWGSAGGGAMKGAKAGAMFGPWCCRGYRWGSERR